MSEGTDVNATDATIDANKLDRMFLAMALLDPREALKSYCITVSEDAIVALENAAEGEIQHWREVVKEIAGKGAAGGVICQFCGIK